MAFHSPQDAIDFAMAGNAYLTLESLKTNRHYTYRINRKEPEDGKTGATFVGLLTAPEEYTYLGLVGTRNGKLQLVTTQKSCQRFDSPPARALNFLFDLANANKQEFPPEFVVRHDGRCGRCGRQLTTPASIERGIGPECATKM